jgi:YfiH family protein
MKYKIENHINSPDNSIYEISIDNFMPEDIHIGFGIQKFSGDRMELHKRLKRIYGNLSLLRQKHSNKVIIAGNEIGKKDFEIRHGDSLITDKNNLVLAVHTADCLPILFFNEDRAIGAVHAGWRGTVQGILMNAFNHCRKSYNLQMDKFKFIFMPAISSCCYEVGTEVSVLFKNKSNSNTGGKRTINVAEENIEQLIHLGIPKKNIILFDNCTYCDTNFDWPSFRKDGKIKRRIISYITMIGKGEKDV